MEVVRLNLDNKKTLKVLRDLNYTKKYIGELRSQGDENVTAELMSIFSKNGIPWEGQNIEIEKEISSSD